MQRNRVINTLYLGEHDKHESISSNRNVIYTLSDSDHLSNGSTRVNYGEEIITTSNDKKITEEGDETELIIDINHEQRNAPVERCKISSSSLFNSIESISLASKL